MITHCGICGVKGEAPMRHNTPVDCVRDLKREFDIERRQWKRMAKMMALQITVPIDPDGAFPFVRAAGDCECQVCRLPYLDHPGVPDFPTFQFICDGKIVKL